MAGPLLTTSSPLDPARQDAIVRTTRGILEERAQSRAAQASTVLGQVRQSDVTLETAGRVARLRSSAAIPGELRVTDTNLLDSLENRVEQHREQRLLRDNPRTSEWFLNYDNATVARDSVADVSFFEGLGNSFARGADRAADGFWLGHRLDLRERDLARTREAMMGLSELVAEERERQTMLQEGVEAQRPERGPEATRRARGGVEDREGDGLPFARELAARSQGFWRYLRSRSFRSEESLREIEQRINADLEEVLGDIAFESAEREQIWPTAEWRREIERDIADNPGDTAAQGFVNILNIAREKPGRFAQYLVDVSVESGITIGAGIAVGAATRSPGLAALTMGAGSGVVGEASFFEELVEEYGYDIGSPEGRQAFLEDPRVIRDLRDKSRAYGIVIGLMDAASAGVASKALVDNPMGDMVAQMLVQALAGGSGEALGRVVAGEDVDWNEVMIEALAETVTAPLEVGGMALSGAQRRVRAAQNERQQRRLFDILSGHVQESDLRQRDRERYADAIRAVTEDGPAENVHVDPDAMAELFQGDDALMSLEEFFDAIPELDYRDYLEAQNSGSLYVVPTSVYASQIAGTEIDTVLRPHIKLRPEDMTQREVETLQEDLARTQEDLEQNVDRVETVIGELEGPLADELERLRSEIVQAQGLRPQDAERQASLLVAAARTGAQRAGITVAEYLRRYTLPTVRNPDTIGPAPATPVPDVDVVLVALSDGADQEAMPELTPIRERLERNGVAPADATRDDVSRAIQELVDEQTSALEADEMTQRDPRTRGSIVLPKDMRAQAIINLFETANMTTMLHETGHFFLWNLQRQAADGLQFAADDLRAVSQWWLDNADRVAAESKVSVDKVEAYLTDGPTGNAKTDEAIFTALNEQFARGFEAYVLEGKSPSNALRSVFESFSAWLLSWYRSAKALNVSINDDIRGVFDRMLATDNEMIAADERNFVNDQIAETAREMGLDEDSYRRLVTLSNEAREEGRQLARKELLATEARMRSKEYATRYAEIEAEERERINQLPVNRAFQWLGYGRWLGDEQPENLPFELRMDTEILREEHPKVIAQLPRGRRPVHKKGTGLSADEVAEWFGFDSGATMLDAMIRAPKAEAAVKAATEARAQIELGDPMADPDQIGQAADDAQHGEKRGQVIVAELRAMNRLGGRRKQMTTRAQAKVIAQDLIQRMPVREALQTNRYLTAERKHAEDAARALAAGQVDQAFEFKRKQLIQHQLYIESRKAAEMVRKAENLAGRLKRKGTRENLAPENLGAIDDILETYDFRKITGKAEVRRMRLQAYIEGMKAQNREAELAIPDHVMNETRRIPYKQLSVRRLQGVYDSLKNIEHSARLKQKLRLAQQERELQEVRDEVSATFDANVVGKPINRVPTWVDRKREGIKGYLNLVRNADTILRRIDGWANRGVMVRYFKQDIDRAGIVAKEMRDQATEAMDKLFSDTYTVREQRQMAVRRKWGGYEQGMAKWDIISIALNTGNKDNLERLTSRDSRGSLTQAEVDALLDNLDKRDWDFVQAVWDYLDNTYWPLISARERRMTGVVPTKVQATPVRTKFGEYRGGYYPIVYDARYSAKVTEDQNADLMQSMMAGRFGKAQTRNGHTKERAAGGGGRTVELGIHVLYGHVNNVIHDLAYGEAVNTSWKLLQDEQIKGEFERNGMLADHQALELWVQDVAAGPAAGTHVMASAARHVKSGFVASKLLFNMSTVAIQITGLAQSAALIGTGPMLKGVNTYLFSKRGRYAIASDIKERSAFMREREETFQRDAYDLYRQAQINPLAGRVERAQHLMMGAGFFALKKVQYYAVDVPTWLGAHQKGLDDGMTDTDAAAFADRMVARAQASGLFADQTQVERGTLGPTSRQNEFLRLFTALGSYMFAKYNVAEEIVGRTIRDVRDPGRSSPLAIFKAASDMLLLFTLEAILYQFIRGALPGMEGNEDEDEGWAEFLAEETALSVVSVFPFFRDVSGAVQGFGGGGAYGGVTETIGRMVTSMGDALTGEATAGDVRSLNDMVGLMVPGYPSTATWRLIDGVGLTGEEPSALSVIMGR